MDTYENIQAAMDGDVGNEWIHNGARYFDEIGRENNDGSITGSVHKITSVKETADNGTPKRMTARRVGSFKIDRDGKVTRFPYANDKMKQAMV